MPPFPPTKPFPESLTSTTSAGPDFPGSAGDRELGKFRPSATPRLVSIAVTDDDGNPIGTAVGTALVPNFEEVIYWLRAIYAGMIAKDMAEDVTEGQVFEGL